MHVIWLLTSLYIDSWHGTCTRSRQTSFGYPFTLRMKMLSITTRRSLWLSWNEEQRLTSPLIFRPTLLIPMRRTVVTHLKIHSLCQSKCTYLSVDCICMQKPSPKFSSTQHKEKAAYSTSSNQKAIPLCGIDCIFGQELQGTS